MNILRFEDAIAWQKSRQLTNKVYDCFKDNKDFSFRDQLQRAVISIMNNIAEGFERNTNKELKNFFYIAKGSSGEVRSMLYIASDRGYINKKEFEETSNLSIEISKILSALIKHLS